MSVFVRATTAPAAKTDNVQTISLILAGVMTVLALAQLFTYEKFANVLRAMWLPGGETYAPIYAALIVIIEVFSVPFFLRMVLSPLMRGISMIFGWLMVVLWLVIFLWQTMSGKVIADSGILGGTIPVPVGWWSVFSIVGLGILVAWVSWGMWPIRRERKAAK